MASRPKTRATDAGLKLEVIRGPKLDKLGRVTWYWRARKPGRGTKTIWSDWATEQVAPVMADAAYRRSVVQQGEVVTVGQMLESWTVHNRIRVENGALGVATDSQYRTRVNNQLIPIFGDVILAELTTEHCDAAARALTDSGYSPRTVNQCVRSVLGSAMSWARRDGWPVPGGIELKAIKVEGYTNNKYVPTDEQCLAVMGCIPDTTERLAVEIMVLTGCRVGSVVNTLDKTMARRNARGLRVEDLDPLACALHLRGKTGARDVPVPARLMRSLEALLEADPPPDGDPRVFRLRDRRGTGRIIDGQRQRLQTVVRQACANAGVPPFTPHALRNAAGVRGLRAGQDAASVAAYLGMSLKTLLEIYDRVTMKTKRDVLHALDVGPVELATANVIDLDSRRSR